MTTTSLCALQDIPTDMPYLAHAKDGAAHRAPASPLNPPTSMMRDICLADAAPIGTALAPVQGPQITVRGLESRLLRAPAAHKATGAAGAAAPPAKQHAKQDVLYEIAWQADEPAAHDLLHPAHAATHAAALQLSHSTSQPPASHLMSLVACALVAVHGALSFKSNLRLSAAEPSEQGLPGACAVQAMAGAGLHALMRTLMQVRVVGV